MQNNFKVSPCSRRELRAFALYIREKTGEISNLMFPIVDVFEALVGLGYFEFEILPVSEMLNTYGETLYRSELIRIREDIYNSACEGDAFARSTMAHELLHFFKHRHEEVVFCKTVEEMILIKPYEDAEWQANCFAGELLVPKHLVENMTIEEVMSQCKVSREMAEYQLDQYKKEGWKDEKSHLVGTRG